MGDREHREGNRLTKKMLLVEKGTALSRQNAKNLFRITSKAEQEQPKREGKIAMGLAKGDQKNLTLVKERNVKAKK